MLSGVLYRRKLSVRYDRADICAAFDVATGVPSPRQQIDGVDLRQDAVPGDAPQTLRHFAQMSAGAIWISTSSAVGPVRNVGSPSLELPYYWGVQITIAR